MADVPLPPDDGRNYILDDENHLVRVGLMRWAQWFADRDREGGVDPRRVAETFTELHRVSTVFLGLDHQFGKGPPLVFETMVFQRGGYPSRALHGMIVHDDLDDECWRYATWDDAVAGHAATVRRVGRLEADAMAKVERQQKGKVDGT